MSISKSAGDEDVDDRRYFLNPESVSIHLFCSICQEVFVSPQRAPCGHSFCKQVYLNITLDHRDRSSAPFDHLSLTTKLPDINPSSHKTLIWDINFSSHRTCINTWLQQSKTCPEDRRQLQLKDLHHDFIVENIIGDQMVACKFRRRGCTHICQLSMYSSHLRNCNFNPSNLPEFLRSDAEQEQINNVSCADSSITEDHVPTPAKPSLKMRLFQAGGTSRDLLCSAFEASSATDEQLSSSLKRKRLEMT